MNRKRLIGKLNLRTISILALFLILGVIVWGYSWIAKRFPIPQSQIQLAQVGITKNADWKPTLHHFSNLDWALVPSGCFNMGSTKRQLEEALSACKFLGGDNCPYVFDRVAQPDTPVCFEKPYWISVTEVTNHEYGSSSSTNMISMYRGPNWPRETITWQKAVNFCESIGARLPTEAEWEYAARGPDGLIYPWGDAVNTTFHEQSYLMSPHDVETVNVDLSWVGARDMAGNVAEWIADRFDPASTPVNAKPTTNHEQRIVHGGSWASYADFLLRTTQRIPYDPEYASSVIGFRCVHDFK